MALVLDEDYGYRKFNYDGDDYSDNGDSVINATEASWTLDNSGDSQNLYPIKIYDAEPSLTLIGGEIDGRVSQTADWKDAYNNSAGIILKNSPDVDIEDWRIDSAWDGIRISDGSGGFEISNLWITRNRDDAIENDDLLDGTIRDSLLDGVFVGLSGQDDGAPDGSNNLVEMDNVLMRMETYLYKGEMTHGPPLKVGPESPEMRIDNSIIAIEDVSHISAGDTDEMWGKVVGGSNNYFLNLSNDDLPDWYTEPRSGWTMLEGQEARDFWTDARADWIDDARRASGSTAAEESRTEETATAEETSSVEPSETTDSAIISGTDRSQTLEGTDGADIFRTGDGARDTIYGLDGADTLVFGAEARDGNQTMERFKDFNPSEDTIVLEQGAKVEWIRERDDRLAISIEGDGDRLYLYGDDLSADDVNFVYAWNDWIM